MAIRSFPYKGCPWDEAKDEAYCIQVQYAGEGEMDAEDYWMAAGYIDRSKRIIQACDNEALLEFHLTMVNKIEELDHTVGGMEYAQSDLFVEEKDKLEISRDVFIDAIHSLPFFDIERAEHLYKQALSADDEVVSPKAKVSYIEGLPYLYAINLGAAMRATAPLAHLKDTHLKQEAAYILIDMSQNLDIPDEIKPWLVRMINDISAS